MKVFFTKENMFGEPGPNLCFIGNTRDFFHLAQCIIFLTDKKKSFLDITITSLPYVVPNPSELKVVFKSDESGQVLTGVSVSTVETILPHTVWNDIYEKCVILSKRKGHFYIEFDNYDFLEECNMIWSSEEE